jgi:hypothetical protein
MSYASTELNQAWLGKDFGQQLATKWGYDLTNLPTGKRGKWKGYIKANLHWEKATVGGWINTVLNRLNLHNDLGKKLSNILYPNEILWSCIVDQYTGEILGFKAHAKMFEGIELDIQRLYTCNHNKENRIYGYDDSVSKFDSIRARLITDDQHLSNCYDAYCKRYFAN